MLLLAKQPTEKRVKWQLSRDGLKQRVRTCTASDLHKGGRAHEAGVLVGPAGRIIRMIGTSERYARRMVSRGVGARSLERIDWRPPQVGKPPDCMADGPELHSSRCCSRWSPYTRKDCSSGWVESEIAAGHTVEGYRRVGSRTDIDTGNLARRRTARRRELVTSWANQEMVASTTSSQNPRRRRIPVCNFRVCPRPPVHCSPSIAR